jgi:hypothetical protein
MIIYESIWKIHMNHAEWKRVQDVGAAQCHLMDTAVAVRCHLMDIVVVVMAIIIIL